MKTNKSYTKRLKVTKNGKILRRRSGQNHFNAKERGRQTMSKHKTSPFKMNNKDISRYLA
ncbi:MAG: 50S ribosomal protein L35 [bacterium]|nr:50S ribosomal protein L35 [bacterium]